MVSLLGGTSNWMTKSATAERTPGTRAARVAKPLSPDSTIATPICGRRAVMVPPAASILLANLLSNELPLAVTTKVAACAEATKPRVPRASVMARASLLIK